MSNILRRGCAEEEALYTVPLWMPSRGLKEGHLLQPEEETVARCSDQGPHVCINGADCCGEVVQGGVRTIQPDQSHKARLSDITKLVVCIL